MEAMIPELALILQQERIETLFQPILDCPGQSVFGYEALSRGPVGSPLHRPAALFSQARSAGQSLALEWLCLKLALCRFAARGLDGLLFVNLSADVLVALGAPRLLRAVQQAGLPAWRVVIELTEQQAPSWAPALADSCQALQAGGLSLALDDLGAGHSDLRLWTELRPDFIKLDRYFVAGVDREVRKQLLVQALLGLTAALGSRLIVEGVERSEELALLRRLGVTYCQGYLIGEPVNRLGMTSKARLRAWCCDRQPDLEPVSGF